MKLNDWMPLVYFISLWFCMMIIFGTLKSQVAKVQTICSEAVNTK